MFVAIAQFPEVPTEREEEFQAWFAWSNGQFHEIDGLQGRRLLRAADGTYTATPDAKPITSTATVNITLARSAYNPAPPKPLAGLGKGLVIALFAIVAAIWLTLIAQIWRVRRVRLAVQEPATSTAYRESPARVGAGR